MGNYAKSKKDTVFISAKIFFFKLLRQCRFYPVLLSIHASTCCIKVLSFQNILLSRTRCIKHLSTFNLNGMLQRPKGTLRSVLQLAA